VDGLFGNADVPHGSAAFQQSAVDQPPNRLFAQVQHLARLVDGVKQHSSCAQFLLLVDDFFLHVLRLKKRADRSYVGSRAELQITSSENEAMLVQTAPEHLL
jgi:hypothetical protein